MTGCVLSDSITGSWAQRLSLPLVSEILLLLSIGLFWYGGLLPGVGLGFLTTLSLPSITLFLALVFTDKSKVKITRSHVFLILFFVFALFSGVLAAGRGINPVLIVSGWVLFGQFFVAILGAQGAANPRRLIKNVVYLSIPMILVGIYQFISHQVTSRLWVSATETGISTRAFALFGSPNVLGAVAAMVALISAGLFLSDFSKDSPLKRTVLASFPMAIISVLATIVTILTFSRSAWVGLTVGIALILVIRNYKLVFLSPLTLLALFIPQIRTRLFTIFTPAYWFDSSLDGRLWSVNNGLHILAKYPVFGAGPGTYGGKLALTYSSPVYLQGIQNGYVALYFTDNQWLQLLVQTGILGIILFTLFVVEMFYYLISQYNGHQNALTLGILGAFVAFIITGFFGNVLEFGAIAVPMGVMLGVGLSTGPGLEQSADYQAEGLAL